MNLGREIFHFGPKGGAVCQLKVYELKVVSFLLREFV